MRLSQNTLTELPKQIARAAYRRDRTPIGIVHFGTGAFHRAHQAWYTDACLNAGESDWGICGVSMRSETVAQQLNPQDGLYMLTERSGGKAKTRVIGAVREVLVARRDRDAIVTRLASPECHLVSFTITEKGYCRRTDVSLDVDLARQGIYPLLAEAMRERKRSDLAGLTLLSCDNLSGNGRQLARLMREWLEAEAPDLIGWFGEQCSIPDSMVDRIVPATTETDLAVLERRLGLRDEGAIFTEPFSQWVIEDSFAGRRPRWEDHGVQIVPDVAPYETAKLRMLNGAHSLLAYAGLEAGHRFVHEAIADPDLRSLTDRLMRQEAAPTITAGKGQDLGNYADALTGRFANSALNHRLSQIAMDGSQKIPQRWLETLAEHQRHSGQCPAILTGLAAWLRHVRGDRRTVEDPLADKLKDAWQAAGKDGIVDSVFGAEGLLASEWTPTSTDRQFITGRL